MLGTFALILAATAADPRPDLVELQLAGKPGPALARVQEELAERPEASRKLGLDFLRGHLLDTLGHPDDATAAFGRSLVATPALKPYSLYRLASDLNQLGHPEMAAGLTASAVAEAPSSPLLPEAVRLLDRTLARGGDCQVLRNLRTERMPASQRRELDLVRSNCAQRLYPDLARSLLVSLLGESREDEIARLAAERLSSLLSESEHGRVPMLVGFTFQRHDELDRALGMLQRAAGRGNALAPHDAYETEIRMGEILLAQQRYAEASLTFARAVGLARNGTERARAHYQEGRAHELRGAGPAADRSYHLAYAAEPQGAGWSAASLLAALRLEWRAGAEPQALSLYEKLIADPKWRGEAARAALFLAASDLVRGRGDRAGSWLARARQGGNDDRLEIDYWGGRLAEIEKNGREAVARYLDVLRADPDHPLAQAARLRLAAEPLSRLAAAEGHRLAGSRRPDDVYGAWLLLGGDPAGRGARKRLEQMLLADRRTAPFLRLAEVPVRRWPLWSAPLAKPEEMLLALGVWHSGAPAIHDHFPLSDPSLGFTGALLLARGGDLARSIATAEALRDRAPSRVPLALQPAEFRRALYPFPYRQNILPVGPIHGVDPHLLVSLIREESHFDTSMLSPASSRGLVHLSLSTARRLAAQLNTQRLSPEDLYRPEVAITLGAAYLGALLKDFAGNKVAAVAAYDAGETEAMLWRSQCFSQEPEELFTKIGEAGTRDYVRRVLAGWELYGELY